MIAGIIKLVESLMVAIGIALGAGIAISTLRYSSRNLMKRRRWEMSEHSGIYSYLLACLSSV